MATALLTDVLPVYPLVGFLAAVVDIAILNPVQFWIFDLPSGEGTGFRHKNPSRDNEPWFIK